MSLQWRGHPLERIYSNMKARCYRTSHHAYKNYGGRGIGIYAPWKNSFVTFVQDIEILGPRPTGYTLDRINNDGDYEPGNVRWASRYTQAQNRRTGLLSEHSPSQSGLSYCSIKRRYVVHKRYQGNTYRGYFMSSEAAVEFLSLLLSLRLESNTTTNGSSK